MKQKQKLSAFKVLEAFLDGCGVHTKAAGFTQTSVVGVLSGIA